MAHRLATILKSQADRQRDGHDTDSAVWHKCEHTVG